MPTNVDGRGCEREQVARHIQVHLHDLVQAPVSETPLSRFFKKERGLIAERWFRTKLVSECL